MGVARIGIVAALPALLLTLGGCSFTSVSGQSLDSTGARTSTGGKSSAGAGTATGRASSAASSSSTGSTTGTTTAGASGTAAGTGGTTTGGSSTGAVIQPLTPTFLLDADAGLIFGPVALTSPRTEEGESIAKLVYSVGLNGTFGVNLQVLSDEGTSLGGNLVVVTNPAVTSPPRVTVFDNGGYTGVCWEDYGEMTNPNGNGCSGLDAGGQLILCKSFPNDGTVSPGLSYSGCGNRPQLVSNPEGNTLLFYLSTDDQVWAYREPPGQEISSDLALPLGTNYVGAPVATSWDAVASSSNDAGLVLQLADLAGDGQIDLSASLDPSFAPTGQLAVAGNVGSLLLGVLELDDLGLRATTWQFKTKPAWTTSIPEAMALTGPLGAATCPNGFAYFAMADGGALLFAEVAFDGGLLAGAGGLFALSDFESTVTSMAAAPNLDGGLLVAVSSPAQVAVYLVNCQ